MSLLDAAAGNRSIFQSLAYNDTVPSFVPKIDINTPIDALQKVVDSSSLEQSKLKALQAAAQVRIEDEAIKNNLLSKYNKQFDDITNLDSPYEQQRQIAKLANQYTTEVMDKSKGLGHLLYTRQLDDAHAKAKAEHDKEGDIAYDFFDNKGKTSLDENGNSTGLKWHIEKDLGNDKKLFSYFDDMNPDQITNDIKRAQSLGQYDVVRSLKGIAETKINNHINNFALDDYLKTPEGQQQINILKNKNPNLTNEQLSTKFKKDLQTKGYERIFSSVDKDFTKNELYDAMSAKGVKQATQEPTADIISSSTTALSTAGALPKNFTEFKSADKTVVTNVVELQKIIATTNDPVQKQQAEAQLFANQNIMATNNAQYKNASKVAGLEIKQGVRSYKDILLPKNMVKTTRGLVDNNGKANSDIRKYADILDEAISRKIPVTEDDIKDASGFTSKSVVVDKLNKLLGFTDDKIDKFNDYLKNNSEAQSISLQTIGITDKTKEALKQIPKTNFKQYTTDGKLLELPEELKPEDIEFKQMAVNNLDNKNASNLQILTADVPVYEDGKKMGTRTIYLTTGDSNTNEDIRNVTIKNLMSTNNEKNHEVARVMANQKYVNEINNNEVKDTKNQRLSTYLPNKGMRVPYRINSISPNLKSYSVSIRGEKITFQNAAQLAEFFHKIDSGTDIPVFDNIEGGEGHNNFKDKVVAPGEKVTN